MELILASASGQDIAPIMKPSLDMEIGGENDFELILPVNRWDDRLSAGNIIYVPDTEFGGRIGGIETDTASDTITLSGMTFRGMFDKKIIEPPAGEAYRIVSGELNTVIRELVEPEFSGLFVVPESDTGVSVRNFQFDRYCTLLSGLTKMLKSVGYRLQLRWIQQERGVSSYLEVSAVPIADYSEQIELSQDSRLDFTFKRKSDGVNHLICLGKGELTEREVIHLYLQADGTIGDTKIYAGLDEIAQTYENTNSEGDELRNYGIEAFGKLIGKDTFDMELSSLGMEINIGDIVGGRDYITGMLMNAPIARKILKISGDTYSIDHRLE